MNYFFFSLIFELLTFIEIIQIFLLEKELNQDVMGLF